MIDYLKLFYDPHCALCRDFKKWVEAQPQYFPIIFIPFTSKEALQEFPDLLKKGGDQEIIGLSNLGYYKGAETWIMTLYALRDYREISYQLGTPAMINRVKPFCHWLSKNRRKISSVLEWFEGPTETVECHGTCRK